MNTLNLIFCLDWLSYCGFLKSQIEKDDLFHHPANYLQLQEPVFSPEQKAIAQIIESSPGYNEKTLHDLIVSMFAKAKSKIMIITPYFVPTESILIALRTAALSGVDVQIIMPGMPDDKSYILTMNRSHYEKLLDANIKVYEYHGFIHSKIILIDDDLTITSTFNLDFRSFFINYESALIVKNQKTHDDYQNIFEQLKIQSDQISPNYFSNKQKKIIK